MKRAFPYAKAFAKFVSNHFRIAPSIARGGVVTFGEDAELQIPFNKYAGAEEFGNAVEQISYEGYRTRIHRGFEVASEGLFNTSLGARPSVPKLLFVVTDGRQSSHSDPRLVRRSYRSSFFLLSQDVKIVAIGMHGTDDIDVEMLQYITRSRENVYVIDAPEKLVSKTFLDGLVFDYCQQTGNNKRA